MFAPVLTEFCEWVLREAKKDGKKRLYFLARDGYALYHLTRELCEARKESLEIRYLKVSRYALRCAGYHRMGKRSLDLICSGGMELTFEKLMKRGALDEAEAALMAEICGYSTRMTEVLSHRELMEIKRKLSGIPDFFRFVNAHARDCREGAEAYLRMEGLFEPLPFGIVDSGWIGTLQCSLEGLLGKETDGYYFGLYEIPTEGRTDRFHSYYFRPGGEIQRKVFFANCLFEAAVSSPEGMTLGYQKHGPEGMFVPKEGKKNPNGFRMEQGKALCLEYVGQYLKFVPDGTELCLKEETAFSAKTAEGLFSLLMGRPKRFEAEAFGNLAFCDDVLELGMQPLAVHWGPKDLKKQGFLQKVLVKSGIRKDILHESAWPEGSVVQSGYRVGHYLREIRLYHAVMHLRKALVWKWKKNEKKEDTNTGKTKTGKETEKTEAGKGKKCRK